MNGHTKCAIVSTHPPKMDRRLPRSPALKSPILSPKSPAIYEKYKSGCAWGLIHFFDFRQGHSHGKRISDKKLANRQAKGKNTSSLVRFGSLMKYNFISIKIICIDKFFIVD